MKRKLVFLLIFSNTASFAQVTTGGGIVIPPYMVTRPVSEIFFKKKIEAYLKQLQSREKLCNSGKTIINSNDLMQVYLNLSMFDLTNSEKNQCEAKDRIFACMNDRKTQEMFKAISDKKYFKNHLKSKYKINDARAKEVIDFFSGMGLPQEKHK